MNGHIETILFPYGPKKKKKEKKVKPSKDNCNLQLVEETLNIKLLASFSFSLSVTFSNRAIDHLPNWHVTDTAGSLLTNKLFHASTGPQETALCCL